MFVGALLDAGASLANLRRELGKLQMDGYSIKTEKVKLSGIQATRFRVKIAVKQKNRDYSAIKKMIEKSRLDAEIKKMSLSIFKRIAEAEAKVHNQAVENVHFHEVGAVDSIVDVVGAAICSNELGIGRFECSPIPTGRGFVNTMHGMMPIPAPATILLLKGAPVLPDDTPIELTTPTGAAIATTLSANFGPMSNMRPLHVGYGAGTKIRQDNVPNLFRVVIGETEGSAKKLMVLETNLDDATPESVSFAMLKALSSGALDVWVAPIMMKKGRQAFCLSVLCDPLIAAQLRNFILEETPTLGVRQYEVQRFELARKTISVKTKYGMARVKIAVTPSGQARRKPEYEDCKTLAQRSGKPFEQVYKAVLSAALAVK
jgi:hypothetical protein